MNSNDDIIINETSNRNNSVYTLCYSIAFHQTINENNRQFAVCTNQSAAIIFDLES